MGSIKMTETSTEAIVEKIFNEYDFSSRKWVNEDLSRRTSLIRGFGEKVCQETRTQLLAEIEKIIDSQYTNDKRFDILAYAELKQKIKELG